MENINNITHGQTIAEGPLAASVAAPPPPPPGSPGALERLRGRFALQETQAKIAGKTLILPELADPQAYIKSCLEAGGGAKAELPYWTKLWPAAMVLAGLAASLPPPPGVDPQEPLLELGAGLGLPGLAAAAHGRRVVLTDHHPDALEFARAAVELNSLEQMVEVRFLDWTAPDPDLGAYHSILGAEILYNRALYPPLAALISELTAPGGTVFISHQERPFMISFFGMMHGRFQMRSTQRGVRDDDGETRVLLHALQRPL